ncbi:dihydrofolate reductase-like domain-containing protein [Staphylotrichum tortipilum]|uniref:Dihydrofolate reductase n=1 Tax=Staphylotrichum tortipilum TaxID=2831512 RepID=A0AAN6MK34_9PEZI|nr:dihydrofolate reductase-like domain-containing protein [Staphylotrichum longicolle]
MRPPLPLLPELTLIVAATQTMGIGRAGTLPWTGLRKEMAYFARVTKRVPAATLPTGGVSGDGTGGGSAAVQNAVVMGRKTWESIPPRFRPLAGRTNVVISRSGSTPQALLAPSLPTALHSLTTPALSPALGRVFIIGGAQIYASALELAQAKRVLLTRVLTEFECDTFFPVELKEGGGEWRRCGVEEMDAWVGEVVPRGKQEEGGVEYVFEMWERE